MRKRTKNRKRPTARLSAAGAALLAGVCLAVQTQAARRPAGAVCFPLQTAVWRVSDGYGTRQDPFTGEERFHQGVDLACAEGTAVLAVREGVATAARRSDSYGVCLQLLHPDGTLACLQVDHGGGIQLQLDLTDLTGHTVHHNGLLHDHTGQRQVDDLAVGGLDTDDHGNGGAALRQSCHGDLDGDLVHVGLVAGDLDLLDLADGHGVLLSAQDLRSCIHSLCSQVLLHALALQLGLFLTGVLRGLDLHLQALAAGRTGNGNVGLACIGIGASLAGHRLHSKSGSGSHAHQQSCGDHGANDLFHFHKNIPLSDQFSRL